MSQAISSTFSHQSQAEALAATLSENDLVVVDRRDEIISEAAPAPYTTADLLTDAIPRYGWSGQQVMKVAQKLFEAGWITYPRTDSQRLAPDAQAAIRDAVSAIYGPDMLEPRGGILSPTKITLDGGGNVSPTEGRSLFALMGERFRLPMSKQPAFEKQAAAKSPVENISPDGAEQAAKSARETIEDAHEAIRPTDPARQPQTLSASREQVQLYALIWQRTLASQMKPARYRRITVEMETIN